MATNLLLGNLQIAKMGDLWGNASLLDSTAYLSQLDMAKVERVQKEEQARSNERVMNVSEAKLTLPKTSTEQMVTSGLSNISSLLLSTQQTLHPPVSKLTRWRRKDKGSASSSPSQITSSRCWAQTVWPGPSNPTAADPTCISPCLVIMILPT